jgi:hypothetical protein
MGCPPLMPILPDSVGSVKNLKKLFWGDTMLGHLLFIFLIEGEVLNIGA